MKTKEIKIRDVVDGLREYNRKVMADEIDEIMRRCRKASSMLPDERLQIQDAADQELIDSLSDRN